jgi:hypothetical protein
MTDGKIPYIGKLDDNDGGDCNEGGTKTDGSVKIAVGDDRLLSDSQKSVLLAKWYHDYKRIAFQPSRKKVPLLSNTTRTHNEAKKKRRIEECNNNSNSNNSNSGDILLPIPFASSTASLIVQYIRNIPELMIRIYEFLPVIDRIRIGQVDTRFYEDPYRGKIVGVYGSGECQNLEFDDAIKEIRKWILYEGSPESWGADGVELFPSECYEYLPTNWYWNLYDKETGCFNIMGVKKWIINSTLENANCDIFHDDLFIEDIYWIDATRRSRLGKIDYIIKNQPTNNKHYPFNALFDMMEDVGLETLRYIEEATQDDTKMEIREFVNKGKKCCNFDWSSLYYQPLRPGRKFVYYTVDGMRNDIILKNIASMSE